MTTLQINADAPQYPPQANVDVSPMGWLPAGPPSTSETITPSSPDDPSSPRSPSPLLANVDLTPMGLLPVVDPLLFTHGNVLNGLERQRISTFLQLRSLVLPKRDVKLTRTGAIEFIEYKPTGESEDGLELPIDHPDVAVLSGLVEALWALEKDARRSLERALRRCRIHPWVRDQVGFGDKQVARLLGVIGDPYWHLAEDRPRTVSELCSYAGYGEDREAPGQPARLRKGRRANWSVDAKQRTYLIAAKCVLFDGRTLSNGVERRRSPYRDVYDDRRARTAVTRPELPLGHSHNDALRIVSKEILKDLWRESKRLHEVSS